MNAVKSLEPRPDTHEPLDLGSQLGTFAVEAVWSEQRPVQGRRFVAWSTEHGCRADIFWRRGATEGLCLWLRQVSAVRHPSLRPVLEWGLSDEGDAWWAIPVSTGPDPVRSARSRWPSLSVDALLRPFVAATRGLAALHRHDGVLGWIDPVLIGRQGDLPAFIGAPPDLTDPRTDQHALGSHLHELLFDAPPDPAGRLSEVTVWPCVQASPAAADLREAVRRAIHPDPAQRHPSAQALATALARVASRSRARQWSQRAADWGESVVVG